MRPEVLHQLEEWYQSHCDGDWEHSFGVMISSLDNPGWSLQIQLSGTDGAGMKLDRVRMDRTATDWIHYWVADDVFVAYGGAGNLAEMIAIFLKWWSDSVPEGD